MPALCPDYSIMLAYLTLFRSDDVSNGISRQWIYFPLDFRQRYHCRAGTKHTSVGLATKFNTYWTIFISSEDNVGPVAEVNNI